MSRSPTMSASHPKWFSSSISNDTNMVICVVTNLVSEISTGPVMFLIYPLSQENFLSHFPDELFWTNSPQASFSATLLSFCWQPCVHQTQSSATCLSVFCLICIVCHSHSVCSSYKGKVAMMLWKTLSSCVFDSTVHLSYLSSMCFIYFYMLSL